jgi:adenylate cyclase
LFIAIAIPLAAMAGFMVAGRNVATLVEAPEMMAKVKELTHWPDAAGNAKLEQYRSIVRLSFAGVLAALGGVLFFAHIRRLAAPKFTIRYVGGPTIKAARGSTLLEISRMNKIPHASVCGGRARCSTCRVRIDDTQVALPAPEPHEAITLGSIQAPENVRLACQIRPQGNMTVTRLLRARSTGPDAADQQEQDSGGVQKDLAVLYLNMRDFTQIAQRKLPYDSVYILNTFFSATGDAVTSHGGRIEQFTGDGMFAVFGQREGAVAGCRLALRAARAIDLALDHVNAVLATEAGKPLQIGIGLHVGSLLVGRIGYGEAVDVTSVGPTMKIARSLDRVAKQRQAQIVVTKEFADVAGWDASGYDSFLVTTPDSEDARAVFAVVRGRDLPASILAKA